MSDVALYPEDARTIVRSRTPLLPFRAERLSLVFDGVRVLDNVDLRLGTHGCTVIMGPNGSGKSLLLRVLHGLVAPTSGAIDWNGHETLDALRRQALVFQKPVLLRRSVAANVEFALKARGRPVAERDALLEQVGLLHKARQPARLLSGGEAQRLALARALATEPEVLFLDEPTANLDPASVLAIETIVKDCCARGVRVLFVTHDIGQARRIADDVVFLSGGKVAEHAPAGRFFENTGSAAARAYLSGVLIP